MNVLVIEPGHGSLWLSDAAYVDRYGQLNPRGRFVSGVAWVADGGWNMPEDYRGYYEQYTTPRKMILKVDAAKGSRP